MCRFEDAMLIEIIDMYVFVLIITHTSIRFKK